MRNALLTSLLFCSLGALAACSSTTKSTSTKSSGLSSKVNMSELQGWKGSGGPGLYICAEKALCKDTKVVIYQIKPTSSNQLAQLRKLDDNPEATKNLFTAAFAIAGSTRKGTLTPDGSVQKISLSDNVEGIGMFIKGTKDDGSPRDPGYMILIPGNTNAHYFIGFSKTKPLAKSGVTAIANAWNP